MELLSHARLVAASRTRFVPLSITGNEFGHALANTLGSGKLTHDIKRGAIIGENLPMTNPSGAAVNISSGLAVSGGVDSMAMAVLCSRLHSFDEHNHREVRRAPFFGTLQRLNFRAFVIDHGVRVGSELEAEQVSRILVGRGIPTEILKMRWLCQQPGLLSNFETLARRQRFQILGQACRAHGIDSLLLAHHEDDQAETVLARLIAGHRGLGLAGIKAQSAIPDCYGLHGVHESGGLDSCRVHGPSDTIARYGLEIEAGGIRIYRPLLGFCKERLISTCLTEEMPWFEDQTNKDPTVTTRNAIRHLYASHSIPEALSKSSLINLARKTQMRAQKRAGSGLHYFTKCKILGFSTRTGTIQVEFPYVCAEIDPELRQDGTSAPQVAAEVLRRVITLVTPRENVELSSLHEAIKRVFPEITGNSERKLETSFTVAGVLFQIHRTRIRSTWKIPDEPEFNRTKCTWLISREPKSKNTIHDCDVIIFPSAYSPKTPWFLFDGRFWMRIQNLSSASHLIIRLLCPKDLGHVRARLGNVMKTKLDRALSEMAPGKVRWTLPIISQQTTTSSEIFSFPTLGIALPGAEKLACWDVRYKKLQAVPHITR